MKRIIQLVLLVSVIQLAGCVAIFMPGKQKVTITTENKDAVVYANREEIGQGESFRVKVKKDGIKQIIVQVPNYKDAYYVLKPVSRPIAFWPMIVPDAAISLVVPFLIIGDFLSDKGVNYPKYSVFKCEDEYVSKTETQKYVRLDAVKFDIKDLAKDLNYYDVDYCENLKGEFARVEKERLAKQQKQESKDKKKKKGNMLETEDTKIKSDDSEFSVNVYNSLKKMGYIDTVNKVFADNNNTLVIEGIITKASIFYVNSKGYTYRKAKLTINWRFSNTYGEVIDSIELEEYSGDFIGYNDKDSKMMADAVDISYFNLMSQPKFNDYLKMVTDFSIKDAQLEIPKAKKVVKEVGEALEASVIIKRKDGSHGSGFAISNDGYILTNFHVIAGKTLKEQGEFQVILPDGTEVPAQIVRYNRMRDIALLKVEHTFPFAFSMPAEKQYKIHQEVYAAGAPKSIELGQTVSMGLMSNERKLNNNTLLQMSISVNPGNSGGPLFDNTGALHGVVTSKLAGYATEGISFAIPAHLIAGYLNLVIK